MKLTIEIKMDNAAFEDPNGVEVARIIREYAKSADGWQFVGGERIALLDFNGNVVGKAEVTADE